MIKVTQTPDLTLLAALHKESFASGWSETALQELLAPVGSMAFVDSEGGGFALARVNGEDAEILTLCVRPAMRKQRIGANLLLTLIDWAKTQNVKHIFLEVRAGNKAAIALYGKAGFTAISLRKDYYTTETGTEHAVVMRRHL